ncbi:echinoderm microtubule-associated protein-like CG42247 [Parasteatoda tepidariorum]|uniref:echinoderm microtubule-associated protein-like CG42247 n=1 Tax=Parasteatoda tepidariorum TaxID=114398 RepID=UPI0039BD6AA6
MMMMTRRRRWRDSEKARRITFYRNGDYFDAGVKVALRGPKPFPTLPHLLDYLSQKTRMPAKRLFSVQNGHEVKSLEGFDDGGSYVVSSDGKFIPMAYGNIPRVQTSFLETALPTIAKDMQLYRPQEPITFKRKKKKEETKPLLEPLSARREGRLLTISTRKGDSSTKLLFNDKNPPPFEELLRDFGRALGLHKVKKMATASGRQVRSLSQMKNEFYDVDTFYLEEDFHLQEKKLQSANYVKPKENKSEVSRKLISSYSTRRQKTPLQLDWVHGYDGSKMLALDDGELLYAVGNIIVLYKRVNARQRHYLDHTENICSMCLHPSRRMVASGQISSEEQEAAIHIWLVETLHTVSVLNRLNGNPVSIDFSSHDFVLLSIEVGGDEDCLSLWDWEGDALLARVQMEGERLSGGCFHPTESDLAITFGKHHMAFWRRKKDGFLTRSDVLAPGHSGRTIRSWAFIGESNLAVGDSSGYLTLWSIRPGDDYKIVKEVRAHQGEVKSLLAMREGTLISGGDDQLKAWDTHERLLHLATTDLQEKHVRTLCMQGPSDATLYVGTTKYILEGSMQSSFRIFVQGIEGEILDLAIDDEENTFVTVDRLRNIGRWTTRYLLWETKPQMECCSIGFHPEGRAIVAGGVNGKLLVLHSEAGLVVATIFVADDALNALSFNGDGSILAIGCEDGNIYVCGSKNHGYLFKIHTVLKNNGPILQMDWSSDGEYLQSSYRKENFCEVSLWKVSESKKVSTSQAQKMDWPQHTCTLSHNVLGIWKQVKDVFYLSCHRKNSKLVTGSQDGTIRIFPYPYGETVESPFEECKITWQPINVVRFLSSNCILSCSGTSVLVWNVKKSST